jgi:hypothetical protein
MATIREYFDSDVRVLAVHGDWTYAERTGEQLASIRARTALDFDANAKYWYFYVPELADIRSCVTTLLEHPETEKCVLSPDGDPVYLQFGFAD